MGLDSNHWYDREGQPCYEVPNKARGGMRPTSLLDARKLNLVPSVTTVLKILAKPNLERWHIKQGILAALTLPRIEGEDEAAWLDRIVDDSQQQVVDAADEGTRIHAAMECRYNGLDIPETYRPHVMGVDKTLCSLFPDVHDWVSERSFAHDFGFGGKVDLHSPSTSIVVDFKGKDGDFTDGKRLAYDQHVQLAAYQDGLRLKRAPCANIFVSRTHPGKVESHVWTMDEIEWASREFALALELWKHHHRYNPSFEVTPC